MVRRGFLLLLFAAAAAAESPDPVAAVLKKIDDKLWFCDRQPGLAGYSVQLFGWDGITLPGRQFKPSPRGKVGAIEVEGKARNPTGTWEPFCGPWRIGAVATWQAHLFAVPWSERFHAEKWTRTFAGDTLTLTPKTRIGAPDMLKPAITSLKFRVGKDGVPVDGVWSLATANDKPQAPIRLEFEDFQGKKRIKRVEIEMQVFNLGSRPTFTYRYAPVGKFTLVERIDMRLPGKYLSPTLEGQDHVSSLQFKDYKVRPG